MLHSKANISEVERVLEIDDIPMGGSGDTLRLRLEVLRHLRKPHRYSISTWRLEHYRVQPTFPQINQLPSDEPCDELLLVRDPYVLGEIAGHSPDEVIEEALRRLEAKFFSKGSV